MMMTFSSLAKTLREDLTIHSPPAPFVGVCFCFSEVEIRNDGHTQTELQGCWCSTSISDPLLSRHDGPQRKTSAPQKEEKVSM